MVKKLRVILFFFIFLSGINILAQTDPPNSISLDPVQLQHSKELIESRAKELQPSYKALIRQADKYLGEGPLTVIDKSKTPPGCDKHDYFSLSIYSLPNPKTKDSLPYITRDGEVNTKAKSGLMKKLL